jgi:hypothetical protein
MMQRKVVSVSSGLTLLVCILLITPVLFGFVPRLPEEPESGRLGGIKGKTSPGPSGPPAHGSIFHQSFPGEALRKLSPVLGRPYEFESLPSKEKLEKIFSDEVLLSKVLANPEGRELLNQWRRSLNESSESKVKIFSNEYPNLS